MTRSGALAALLVLAVAAGCAHRPAPGDASPPNGGAGPAPERAAPAADAALWRTAWRLEDLSGAGVLDRVEATLEFLEPGKVAGRASCNRFFGSAKLAGESIAFGALGATRMACAEAIARQETKYLEGLQNAERYALDGVTLRIYVKGDQRPLRFVRIR